MSGTETPFRAGSMIPVMVRMPPALYEAVKRDAETNDRTISQTIRRAVRLYLAERAR